MACSSNVPHAETLVDLDGSKKITTNVKTFENLLLQPEIQDKHVCVVSITGTYRQGKSFLLNFLLRYLDLKYKKKRLLGKDWIAEEDGKITGFEWKSGSKRHTTGILMWSEIFLAQLPSGEEIAIILLDTQGTFDNKTEKQQCAAIFAISTLISSVQILNLKNQITQSDLEHMECFSGYGQLASENSNAPFQDVCFLIRDWQCPYEHPYGASEAYLKGFLEAPGQPERVKKQNENIEKLFENKKCFLLPYPGRNVATNECFRGELKEIDAAFIQNVEALAPFLLSPENLVPKTVNGEKIKVRDLFYFIQSYCKYFMSNEVPKLDSMYLATANAHYNAILQDIIIRYKNFMNLKIDENSVALEDDKFQEEHKKIKNELTQDVNNKNIMGKKDMQQEYEAKLNKTLDDVFQEYRKINNVKLQKEKEIQKFSDILKKKQGEFEDFDKIVRIQKKEIQEAEKKRQEMTIEIGEMRNKINELQKQRSGFVLQLLGDIAQAVLGFFAFRG